MKYMYTYKHILTHAHSHTPTPTYTHVYTPTYTHDITYMLYRGCMYTYAPR